MVFSTSISRLINYYQRHGIKATIQRIPIFFQRNFSSRRFVVYYFDLLESDPAPAAQSWPDRLTVTRISRQEDIGAQDWQKITDFWNPEISRRNFAKRFKEGATAWLICSDGNLAGYGWTLTGRPLHSHFVPFGPNDVHLFDFLVFPEFRGQRINPLLVGYILDKLVEEKRTRAYIEVAEWNQPQLASLSRTGFQLMGVAHKISLGGRNIVVWSKADTLPASTTNQRSPKN
jgi:ribosomal protein S18 acetylase RimI-like enzyme